MTRARRVAGVREPQPGPHASSGRVRPTVGTRRERWDLAVIVGIATFVVAIFGVFLAHGDAERTGSSQAAATPVPTAIAEHVRGPDGREYVAVGGQLYADSPSTVTVTVQPGRATRTPAPAGAGQPTRPNFPRALTGLDGPDAASETSGVLPFPWLPLGGAALLSIVAGVLMRVLTRVRPGGRRSIGHQRRP